MKKLVVILGAGASFDCVGPKTPAKNEYKPPLVTELFSNRSSFAAIQSVYHLAASAASEIRASTEDSESIENFLRERYRDSSTLEDRRAFFEIPLYLQHILLDVSNNYTQIPDNYNILVQRLNRLEEVIYLTLNYDLILDRTLSHSHSYKLSNMNDYISDRKNWSLIKLHGSVNWGYETNVPKGANEKDFFRGVLLSLYDELKDNKMEIVLRDSSGLKDIRFQPTPPCLYYPALSVPVGSEDELICPKEHTLFLLEKLKIIKDLNLLIIGYSGNDKEVVNLLQKSGANIAKLKVVNC